MIGLVALGLVAFISAQVECPSTTVALTNIYDDMGGASWNTNNWFSTADFCTWTGIECNINGDVIYMDLSGMNLTGPISPYFECLPYLKSLYLNNNTLTGPIPTAICELTNLSYLQIQNSGLTGTIPECLCDLTNIMYMYFSNNALTGTIPTCLGDLAYLRELHLDCNDLSGSVPLSFNNLPRIEEIRLNCNPNLVCTAITSASIYECDPTDCANCDLTPSQCPPYIDVDGCGRYYPDIVSAAKSSSTSAKNIKNTKSATRKTRKA